MNLRSKGYCFFILLICIFLAACSSQPPVAEPTAGTQVVVTSVPTEIPLFTPISSPTATATAAASSTPVSPESPAAPLPTITAIRVMHRGSTPTGPSPDATLTPDAASEAACPGALPSRLAAGEEGRVSTTELVANRVRRDPDREAELLGQITPGETFTVLEGPRCARGFAWYRIRAKAQNLEGWTVEGDGDSYWLEPLLP